MTDGYLIVSPGSKMTTNRPTWAQIWGKKWIRASGMSNESTALAWQLL